MKKIFLISFFISCSCVLCANWYNSNVIYYKLLTHKTGISKVKMSDLSDVGLDLTGKDTMGIHLLYNGKEISYHYMDGELIYCIPKADELDEYSNDIVVFLYYDADNLVSNKVFEEAIFTTNIFEYLKQNLQLEIDREYFLGYDILDYRKTRFTGWYWKILTDYPTYMGTTDTHTLKRAELIVNDLYLFPQPDSLISIKSYLTTLVSEAESNVFNAKRKVSSYINNDSISYILFDSLVDSLIFESKLEKTFAGINEFRLLNNTVDTVKSRIQIGVNKICISGYLKPYFHISNSYQSNTLDINSVKENSLVTINGFADSTLYLFDGISKSFIKKNNIPVTHISVNTKHQTPTQTFLTNILINNKDYKSEIPGIHIIILEPGTKEIVEHYAYSYSQSILTLLQNAEDSSVICIAINTANEITNPNFRNYLSGIGFSKIMDYNGGDAYICAYKKGANNDLFMEELNKETKICSKDISFYDTEKRWFAADISLVGETNGINYSLLYSDSSNVNVARVSKVNFTNLKDSEIEAELIIIYHNDFKEKSLEYAEYKKSKNINVKCIDVEDVYKEFGNGNKSPHNIKDFLRYAYYSWNKQPKYVLFIGDASTDPRLCDTGSITIDYIPVYGDPVSDYWYGIFDMQSHNSELIIGRIPVSNNVQLENYIEKVKIYENNAFDHWNRNFMFVNGGNTINEINGIKQYADMMATMLFNSQMCADTICFQKTSDSGIIYKNRYEIIRTLNDGIAMTIFHGHGSVIGFDNWGWPVDNLSNVNRYGILATMSCNTGAFADPQYPSLVNENFILSYKDKGYVAALGSTTNMTISVNQHLQYLIVEALNKKYRKIGDILHYAKSNYGYADATYKHTNIMEYTFGILGDPMIEIKIDTIPDLYTLSNEIVVTNEYDETVITEDDTQITIRFPLYNAGIVSNWDYNVKVECDNKVDSMRIYDVCGTQLATLTLPINPNQYEIKITITIDTENDIKENNKENNIITKTIKIMKKGVYPIEPLPETPIMVVNKNDLHFRFLKWQYAYNESYDFYISDENNNIIGSSILDEINFTDEYVDWIPTPNNNFSLYENTNYFINAKQYSDGYLITEQIIPFSVADTVSYCDTCAELLFISKNMGLDTNNLLRGDTAFFKVELANISLRTAIENIIVTINEIGYTKAIERLESNEHIQFIIPIPTTDLYTANSMQVNINSKDLYGFNNTYNFDLYVYEDTTLPTLEIYIDSEMLLYDTHNNNANRLNISSEPDIKIVLYDNSYLPILIAEPIRMQLNSNILSTHNTQSYELDIVNDGKLKAILKIKPELLEEKENLFIFYGTDGSGNRTTKTYRMYVTINNNIKYTEIYPNPVKDATINIKYELERNEVNGFVKVDIYDIFGKHINHISSSVDGKIGVLIWNQDDKSGYKVAQGFYTYILSIIGNNWMEPIFGKIQIVK